MINIRDLMFLCSVLSLEYEFGCVSVEVGVFLCLVLSLAYEFGCVSVEVGVFSFFFFSVHM